MRKYARKKCNKQKAGFEPKWLWNGRGQLLLEKKKLVPAPQELWRLPGYLAALAGEGAVALPLPGPSWVREIMSDCSDWSP